ncbi:MAG: cytochrome b5-like heme/steroid binding domain-containing protein [Thermoplasmata archaeon]
MERKKYVILLTLIIVIIIGVVVYTLNPVQRTQTTIKQGSSDLNNSLYLINSDDKGNQNKILSVSGNIIKTSELALHNSETDCWVVYKGKVYDLTSWLDKHPGGVKPISKHCGTFGFEEAFIKKHGDSKASLFMQVAKLMGDAELKGSI